MTSSHYLDGTLLLAMPTINDPRFDRSVIYVCTHDEQGAMGLVINQFSDNLSFPEFLEQLNIDVNDDIADIPIHTGGPVEPGRGFILHSADFAQDSTLIISETIALTATVDILKAMAKGEGPKHQFLALGYSGWGPGQLESEIKENAWLTAEADEEIIFNTELEQKWPRTMAKLGINVSMLSPETGSA